ncbi:uncharacterized protein LOC124271366 isoform X2 [Haliotis rubra]|uniref:uncharacterized protein LOC124271366 isoform X2 n=1 Tax=Haliotis rubra TaxID=36100 RepID=UPI001EE61C8E|nr:uncharacterized protein LOC124271366 isoform X2 [Haliotis rubra]
MNALLCLVIALIPVVYAGNVSSWHRFDRQVTLQRLKAREHPFTTQASPNEETCASLCAEDRLCAAVTFLEGTCSMYRSSLTSSGKSVLGAKHFIKAGDPCPASMGYTSVLSPRLCYKYIPISNTWTHHSARCQAEDGRLIVLNSQETQEYIASFQGQADVSGKLWVGMQKLNNVFTWQEGSTYVWKWSTGEPDNDTDQNCVQLFYGKLSDRPCHVHRQAVCEIPL